MEKYHQITICALKSSHLQARHKKWSRPATAHKGAEEIGVRAKIGENANFFGFQRSMLIQLIHFCFSTLQYGCFNPHRQWLNIDIEPPSNRNISSILLKVHIFTPSPSAHLFKSPLVRNGMERFRPQITTLTAFLVRAPRSWAKT